MTLEEALVEITNLQAKVQELKTTMETNKTDFESQKSDLENKLQTSETEKETLRTTNMDLFLKVQSQFKKEETGQENKDNEKNVSFKDVLESI